MSDNNPSPKRVPPNADLFNMCTKHDSPSKSSQIVARYCYKHQHQILPKNE